MARITGTHRRWCFTINNPSIEILKRLKVESGWNKRYFKFVILQLEKGESGTPHIQGYCVFHNPVRLSSLRKHISDQGHYEVAKGSTQDNIKYCSKFDSKLDGPWQFGDHESCDQGSRSDLLEAKRLIEEGKPETTVASQCFSSWVKYHSAFNRYRTLISQNSRTWMTSLKILIGPSGVGKSRWTLNHYPSAYWMMRPNGKNAFFDGYDGQDCIVLDDFYGWITYDLLLRLIDRYPLNLQVKGGSVPCLAKTIVITSNVDWNFWYPKQFQSHGCKALERRIKEFGEFIKL